MPIGKQLVYALNSLILFILIFFGILLFTMREKKMPSPIAHEVTVSAKPSRQMIVDNQFLILVKKSSIKSLPDILDPLGLKIKTPILDWILVQTQKDLASKYIDLGSQEASSSSNILNSLLKNPKILDAHHNFLADPAVLPTNKNFEEEWQLHLRSSKNQGAIELPFAWEVSQGSKDVSLAIVDHFLFQDVFTFKERFAACSHRVKFFRPFKEMAIPIESNSIPHGEVLLHALGSCANIKSFSSGVDWHANLIAVERPALGHAQSFLAALYASNIDVCKESIIPCPKEVKQNTIGITPDVLLLPFTSNAPDLLQFTSDMLYAIQQKNIIVVSAAGNNEMASNNFFPGGAPGMLNVGSLNKYGKRSDFTNWGQTLDILAPGENIKLYYPSGEKTVSGTSIAAAYVAGTVSLMKSVNKSLNPKSAEYFLKKSSNVIECEDYCKKSITQKPDVRCQDLCCGENKFTCGLFSLNTNNAIRMAQNKTIDSPLISLSHNYILFLREGPESQNISVKNLGDISATITTFTYDDNVVVSPKDFVLGANGKKEKINISFKKEPFKRQTFKVEFIARLNGQILDRSELYLEFIPKK